MRAKRLWTWWPAALALASACAVGIVWLHYDRQFTAARVYGRMCEAASLERPESYPDEADLLRDGGVLEDERDDKALALFWANAAVDDWLTQFPESERMKRGKQGRALAARFLDLQRRQHVVRIGVASGWIEKDLFYSINGHVMGAIGGTRWVMDGFDKHVLSWAKPYLNLSVDKWIECGRSGDSETGTVP